MFIDTACRMARLCRILQQEKDAIRFAYNADRIIKRLARKIL
jgi:hypothetical protein